ncbi:MAG: lipoprotein-releasing system ATP-binding protein [Sphingobacteriales bacterium]|jgi:lipoprotein-releasing system ATP-binding protein
MLRAKNIHKKYNDLEILKGVDLHVKKGEVVSIVGASGAGKSTLLHIIGTLDKADQGELEINNTAIHNLSTKNLDLFRNTSLGFIFQFHHLLPEFSAIENVCMPAYIAKKPTAVAMADAKKLLDRLGLGSRINHKPSQMSGGEQQRVAIARALINKPALILADEPSGNLDSTNSSDLHNLFFELRDEMQQTFVIVTHNEHLAEMADRKLVIQDGLILN